MHKNGRPNPIQMPSHGSVNGSVNVSVNGSVNVPGKVSGRALRRTPLSPCTDQVVGAILSGWRYDISGLSPMMRTDYDLHMVECAHCRSKQRLHRTVDVLLISVSTLSIVAFLLAAVVMHHVETVTHVGQVHVHLLHAAVYISLEAVAIAGLFFSTLLWILVAIATPLPGYLGNLLQQRLPEDIRQRFSKNAA